MGSNVKRKVDGEGREEGEEEEEGFETQRHRVRRGGGEGVEVEGEGAEGGAAGSDLGARLAIVSAAGSRGDVNPMIGIGRELKRLGFDVVISLAEPYVAAAEAAGLRAEGVIGTARFEELLGNRHFWTPVRGARAVLRTVATEFLQAHHAVIRRHHRPGRTVLVAHPLDFASRVLRDADRSTPMVDVHLAPAILRVPGSPPRLSRRGFEQWLPRPLLSMALRAADRWILDPTVGPAVNRLRAEYGLAPVRRLLDRWWFANETTVAMYPDWFAPEVTRHVPPIATVGFPLEDADAGEFDVPAGRPIVVTGGTANRHAAAWFRRVIEATGRTDRELWVLTRYRENLPSGPLPSHVRVEDYVPLGRLLPHCDAILHHGGIGTTSQALAAGVPQVIRPLAFDQFDNAARVERLGAGRRLRSDRQVGGLIEEVCRDGRIRDAAERCGERMRPGSASREAAELIAARVPASV